MRVVFDPNTEPHHHFVDEDTGRISDLEREALRASGVEDLDGLRVRDDQVVVRGKRD